MTGARIALPRLWRARPAAARPRGGARPRRLRLLVIGGVAAVLVAAAWYWGRDLSLWSVDSVHVTGATGQDAAQIDAALQSSAHGMTTLHVRTGDLRDAVARFPIVRSVRVHPSFPHGLRIEVVENVPVAALVAAGRPVAVAADGTLLRDRPVDGLPLVPAHAVPTGGRVTDAQATGAIALAGAAPAGARPLLVRVRSGGQDGLRVDLQGGFRIEFGPRTRLHAKWAAALRVMADARAEGATYLDVRVPERPVAGGAFVAPLPSAVPAKTSSTPSDPAAGSTDGTAAAGDPQTQNPGNTGGEPPA
ncbi:MAG: cell division protein FtsQ [Solirubrobacteraceae bacterium]|jgi:cell division protein FtsQ|nr:cell division protein FtsQ [Solirubrobacteraceae bacterium]